MGRTLSDLTPEEIKEIKNKPLVPVTNKTTDGKEYIGDGKK